MHATAELDEIRTSEEARPSAWQRIKELVAYREILMNLIRKEVKVKYTSSKLGAIWSMLNPLLYLAVFSLVFGVILKSKAPDFAVYCPASSRGPSSAMRWASRRDRWSTTRTW
jgi:hypothetical protein